MKRAVILSLFVGLFIVSAYPAFAQDQPTTQPTPTAEEVEKEKAEREKNAYRLLDQVIDESQSLRNIENRVRVQINSGDLLWKNNQQRARSLFMMAAEGIGELGRAANPQPNNFVGLANLQIDLPPNRSGPNRSFQLRQELVLAAAKHDAPLAYQLLAATKPPANTTPTEDQRGPRVQFNSEESLEQTLLGRIASLDPRLAAQNAEAMMDKGQFPRTLTDVISQLSKQDQDAGNKLADKTVKKLQTANLLASNDAGNLVQALLLPGPRQPAPATSTATTDAATTQPRGRTPVLEQQAYTDLLNYTIDAALKATPQQPRTQTIRRIGPGGAPGQGNPPSSAPSQPSDAQLEQANARRLLANLQATLPMIDQYAPSKAPQIRQKLAELGMQSNQTGQTLAMSSLQGDPTSDALLQAAAALPPQMQPNLYQRAAYKALDEGNPDRAKQIANDHLQSSAKDSVMRRIEFRELAQKTENTRIDEIRLSLAKLPNENERLNALLALVKDIEKSNPKLMKQLLEDARQMVNRRATNYTQLEQQIRVADAFAAVDTARSFEILDPGISQLNELLQAASVLSGFEVNIFRDGEMSIQGGGGLASTVTRYGQELANLARLDFERSETLASRFQFPESRILARMAIVQGLLNTTPANQNTNPAVRVGFGPSAVIR